MTAFTLHLLRHGAPERTGLMLGRTDLPVTTAGVAACRAAATGVDVERVIASDLRRARACAEAIAGEVVVDPRWRELDFGAWDGLAAAECPADALARFWHDPDAHPPPGGERWGALVARVGAAVAALAPVPTLVVTHAGAMRATVAALCGWSWQVTASLDLPYAALLSLRVWPVEAAIVTGLRA